eukprot:6142828-Pleurochrysis_carterae.AAC.4
MVCCAPANEALAERSLSLFTCAQCEQSTQTGHNRMHADPMHSFKQALSTDALARTLAQTSRMHHAYAQTPKMSLQHLFVRRGSAMRSAAPRRWSPLPCHRRPSRPACAPCSRQRGARACASTYSPSRVRRSRSRPLDAVEICILANFYHLREACHRVSLPDSIAPCSTSGRPLV